MSDSGKCGYEDGEICTYGCPRCDAYMADAMADALKSYQTDGRYRLAADRALAEAMDRGVDTSDPGKAYQVLKGRA